MNKGHKDGEPHTCVHKGGCSVNKGGAVCEPQTHVRTKGGFRTHRMCCLKASAPHAVRTKKEALRDKLGRTTGRRLT